jgi:hypothetical protein
MSRDAGKRTLEERLEHLHQLVTKQMKNNNEYRGHAADAQREADKARNAADFAAWLRVARGWFSLILEVPSWRRESFAAQARRKEHINPARTRETETVSASQRKGSKRSASIAN